jgi:iron-sulfur cluster assembly accessory protein
MSVATFDINRELLTVTPAAAEHFRRSMAGGESAGVRISVRESGCTGFKYVVEVTDDGAEGDLRLELENGVRLYLDPAALSFLRGTEIDYTREGVNRSLKFNNPNVVAECGCGESFSVE